MGLSIGFSKSSFDGDCTQKKGNPDPRNWVLMRKYESLEHLVVWLRYPDCINYEGNKILLYLNTTWKQLDMQRVLDPHFSSNKMVRSPFARFEPTEKGWEQACILADDF